uniref:Tail assembly chaperone n=1 Tax=Candidatus Kentrum sp. UNK TaxID=2126344 RepID=A0A450ZWQ6_9GAMM|nr:MAG: hypothetical protein BECKUNK1418G_GA0071005_100236 [Candidatus Kentron sp. UNK]VFK68299.1 MAG: hypothetical protein BECKUNK1418H_GA0071006_100136 [Candidatus Kentron sp. UNK]
MGFILSDKDKIVKRTVVVNVPVDGDATVRQEFTASFRVLPDDQLEELMDRGEEAFLKGILVGWEGIDDDDGNPVSPSPEAITRMSGIIYVRTAIYRAYWQMMAGDDPMQEAIVKNSPPPLKKWQEKRRDRKGKTK